MRRRAVPAAVVVGLVAAVIGLVPGDEATGHTCFRVETAMVTSTTLGDPSCQLHNEPEEHACVSSVPDPTVVVCDS